MMRRPCPRDEGVSSVLGAVLVFGLLVVTLVTVQVRFVPVWDRDREAEHMQALGNQLAQLKSDLDRIADNRSAVPVTDPVTLAAPQGFRMFRGVSRPADLGLVPSEGDGLRIRSSAAHVLEQDGRPLFAGSETWTQVVQGGTVQNLGAVHNLRLRIPNPTGWRTGDSLSLTLTDADGAYAGRFTVTNTDHGETYRLRHEAFAASSTTVPVSQWDEDHDKSSPPNYLYVDLLDRRYQFDQILAAAKQPASLLMARNNLAAEYTASYTQVTPSGGSTHVGGGGRLIQNFSHALESGRVTVAAHNQRYVDQRFVVEHGAVLLVQPDGATMFAPPSMAVRVVGGIVDVRWTVPGIQGTPTTLSGPASAGVTLTPGAPATVLATMPRLDVSVPTEHGTVWAQHWTSLLQGAGLAYGTQFTVESDTASASLHLFGAITDPLSPVDDVTLSFRGAGVSVSPKAGA